MQRATNRPTMSYIDLLCNRWMELRDLNRYNHQFPYLTIFPIRGIWIHTYLSHKDRFMYFALQRYQQPS